ncbi:MAG TPA: lysophospholipid acyltransferase family protein, partial [Dehalococcoidia bacterium]|nr:lysophospholipid acyltransferase family protein [Dehalococcoidia bacterium]
MPANEPSHEQRALGRWRPGVRWYHPAIAFLVIRLSRLIMRRMNRLDIEGVERFDDLHIRGARGLLTFSNHVSMFDDPLLLANLGLPKYSEVRWVAADALNFFGSPWKAWLFTAGKAVPVIRGAGINQPGLMFLLERLKAGEWVHIFPEGKRTRKPVGRMSDDLKSGIGMLMAEALPIALPFYHHGMHDILPVGSLRPRRGKRVRLVFGEPIDCAELAAGQS